MKEKKLETFSEALIIAGSNDLFLVDVLSLFQEKHRNILPLYSSIGSMNGINALKKGWCHICASHMLQKEDEEYNLAYIKEVFNEDFVILNFAYRTQGLLVSPSNPKHINGIKDLVRPDITIVNRQSGTGTRFLLEYEMEKNGIDAGYVKGYGTICMSHLDVGIEVLSGRADAGLGIQAIARMLGLDFIPLRKERFDLIIRKETFPEVNVQTFLKFLRSPELKQHSARFGGYDLRDIGKIMFEG
jgi:molybdate-binding protein